MTELLIISMSSLKSKTWQGPWVRLSLINGKTQVRIAETEKYPHVTFFFSGGRESQFDNERRILVNSPKVATYDLKPEMSAYAVSDKIVDDINENPANFICLNFAKSGYGWAHWHL